MQSLTICNHQNQKSLPTISTDADLDKWLQVNTVKCERLGSRIEPDFCKTYRRDRLACHGCKQAEEMDRAAVVMTAKREPEQISANKIEEATVSGKHKACLECAGTDKKIIGRGLCGSCYHQINKIPGQLDERYPRLGRAVDVEQGDEDKEPAPAVTETKADDVEPVIADWVCVGSGEGFVMPDVQHGACEMVPLHFLPSDAALLEFLQKWAREERRSLDQQILAILDNAKAAAA